MNVQQRARLAEELSRRLAAAIRGIKLYSPGHPLVRRNVITLLDTLASLHEAMASVAIGMTGYACFERLSWLDAFLETAMLLGGMGPIHAPQTDAGKLFAGIFALYAGLVFIATAALLLGPVVHRLLHHFHLEGSRRHEP